MKKEHLILIALGAYMFIPQVRSLVGQILQPAGAGPGEIPQKPYGELPPGITAEPTYREPTAGPAPAPTETIIIVNGTRTTQERPPTDEEIKDILEKGGVIYTAAKPGAFSTEAISPALMKQYFPTGQAATSPALRAQYFPEAAISPPAAVAEKEAEYVEKWGVPYKVVGTSTRAGVNYELRKYASGKTETVRV